MLEAVKRAGSLESEKVRDAILKMDLHTVFGAFKVDRDGFQIAHKMLLSQWQGGKKVDRLARGAGVRQAALPDAAVEPALSAKGSAR